MPRSHGRFGLLLLVLTLALLCTALPAGAQGNRYFPETGFIVDAPILSAFERFGDVPLIGLPISDAMATMCEQHPCSVQWFERTRVEVHHDTNLAYRGRIGVDFLAQRGTPWQPGDGDLSRHAAEAPCLAFSATGHVTCNIFLDAWKRSGGLERLGLPISGVQDETYVDSGTGQTVTFRTQWFERGALEDHGAQRVHMRLLGSQIYPTWAERLLATLINAERTKAGLGPIIWNDELAAVARGHSLDLARHNLQGHVSSDGRTLPDRLAGLSLPGYGVGEIVAYDQSPVRSFEAFTHSSEHHRIMLLPQITHAGAGYGVVLGPVRGQRWPATVWTIDFWAVQ